MKKPIIYEVLKGYEVLAVGTAKECAEKLGVGVDTIYCYASPSHHKRRDNLDRITIAYKIEEE